MGASVHGCWSPWVPVAIVASGYGHQCPRVPVPAAPLRSRVAGSGADDLLPLVSFTALRSGLPQLLPECAALEEFIHEG